MVLKSTIEVVAAGELIVVKGQLGDRMWLILDGAVDVYLELGQPPVARLSQGNYVGESSILDSGDMKRSAYVRASFDSQFIVLRKPDVIELANAFPDFKKALKRRQKVVDISRDESKSVSRSLRNTPIGKNIWNLE